MDSKYSEIIDYQTAEKIDLSQDHNEIYDDDN